MWVIYGILFVLATITLYLGFWPLFAVLIVAAVAIKLFSKGFFEPWGGD